MERQTAIWIFYCIFLTTHRLIAISLVSQAVTRHALPSPRIQWSIDVLLTQHGTCQALKETETTSR